MAASAISCRALSVRFDNPDCQALAQVSFELAEGEILVVAGRCGAGKSTLLECLNRVVPTLRRAEVEGAVTLAWGPNTEPRTPDLAPWVGVVFQDFEAQLFSTRVVDELVFSLELARVDPGAMPGLIADALALVGLSGFEARDPASLSGGEKQRLALAVAIAKRPRLLILDEPTTDLDPQGRQELLHALAQLEGVTVVVAEHEVGGLTAAAQWLILDKGRPAALASPRELLADPVRLEGLGVRPPDTAMVAAALGLECETFDLETVAAAMRAQGVEVQAPPEEPSPRGDVVVEAHDLLFRYPGSAAAAVSGASLSLCAGEVVAILGGNGSGKTTLSKVLAGLLQPEAGTVRAAGHPIGELSAAQRAQCVGVVFQDPDHQIFSATVREEIAFGPRACGLAAAEIESRSSRVMERLGLVGLEDLDPFVLGKGDRQRLAIASTLVLEPQVLVLDEPTTGLDFGEQRSLVELLRELAAHGTCVVIITHVPWFVGAVADRGILMAEGEVLLDEPLRAVFADRPACRRADFVVPEGTRLGAEFGVVPRTVEELLSWCR